jgi:hypothetical protein
VGAARATSTRSATGGGGTRRWAVALAVLAMVVGLVPGAAAQDAPYDRGIADACRDGVRSLDVFEDVPRELVHAGAIDCMWASEVVVGRDFRSYAPDRPVTRQQMATFVTNMLRQILDRFHTLPAPSRPNVSDADDIATAHRGNVGALMEAGIVSGYPDGTFRPGLAIDRAQVASFLARAVEDVTGEPLPRTVQFDDVRGTHRANVEKLASIGVVQGRQDGRYDPSGPTTRAQMATIVARSLDFLAAEGFLVPVEFAHPGGAARLGLTDVALGAHAGFDRATFTLDAGEGLAGWRIRYVDEARALGSGDVIDVDGDAILRVLLEGMALPPDLDEDTWDGGRAILGGAAIVEVVDDGVFEGQHQLFIGTTGLHHFEVTRRSDPRRVVVDVQHP